MRDQIDRFLLPVRKILLEAVTFELIDKGFKAGKMTSSVTVSDNKADDAETDDAKQNDSSEWDKALWMNTKSMWTNTSNFIRRLKWGFICNVRICRYA